MAEVNTAIGTIINARGVLIASKPDGSQRIVTTDDWLYADDVLTSQFHAFAEVRLFNGAIFEVPSESIVSLADTVSASANVPLTDELIEQIQEAIARGEDPSEFQPAPAAGNENRAGGQLFEPAFIAREGRIVNPDSGFESSTA